MADDNLLLNAIQTGANIGNMRVMRQERMMELQSQEALRQIQERHLAAQADMLSYNLDQAKADKAKEDADLQKADMMHKVLTETVDPGDKTPEEVNQLATQATDDWLVRNNPKAALKVANARFLMSKPEIAQQTIQSRENIATGRNAVSLQNAQTNAEARKYSADQHLAATVARLKEGGMGHEAATTFAEKVNNWRDQQAQAEEEGDLDTAASFGMKIQDAYKHMRMTHPDQSQTIQLKNLQAEANKAYGEWVAGGMKNKKLEAEVIRTRKALADAQGGGGAEPATNGPAANLKLKVGTKYRNAKGEERTYGGVDDQGNPIWTK